MIAGNYNIITVTWILERNKFQPLFETFIQYGFLRKKLEMDGTEYLPVWYVGT